MGSGDYQCIPWAKEVPDIQNSLTLVLVFSINFLLYGLFCFISQLCSHFHLENIRSFVMLRLLQQGLSDGPFFDFHLPYGLEHSWDQHHHRHTHNACTYSGNLALDKPPLYICTPLIGNHWKPLRLTQSSNSGTMHVLQAAIFLFGGGQYLAHFGWSAAFKPTVLNNQKELDQVEESEEILTCSTF